MVWDVLIFATTNRSAFAWTSDRIFAIVLGVILAIFSIVLLLASWTRWGQTKPLTKCIILSVLAHVWLLMYAYGTRVVSHGYGPGKGSNPAIVAEWVDESPLTEEPEPSEADPSELQPWEKPLADIPFEVPSLLDPIPAPTPPANIAKMLDQLENVEPPTLLPASQPEPVPTPEVATVEPIASQPDNLPSVPEVPSAAPALAAAATAALVANSRASNEPTERTIDHKPMPEAYKLRSADARRLAAQQYGGDSDTEAAVDAALEWLKQAQDPQGFWDADKHGAGRETKTLGEDRNGTGREADNGMTGLAMLAFLGAGHTHVDGPHQDTMQRAADYLMRTQMPSGDMSGPRQVGNDRTVYFARMYCHGMATLALAELYAMTGDPKLVPSLTKAAEYTLRAQNPRTGGWRYNARETNDPGDLSQFGWQAMSLHSCENGGFRLAPEVKDRLATFLNSVKSGKNGGLAVYRPVPGQSPTPAMTAEALACRLMLGVPTSLEAEQEAKRQLLSNLPGSGEDNLYLWYYATIAMFQYQDQDWQVWNEALKTKLVNAQLTSGPQAGSWDTTCIWSGYGGRVYSTAMSCMCLEVYYRFLPIYQRNQMAQNEQIIR